jgi:hypothetical protein
MTKKWNNIHGVTDTKRKYIEGTSKIQLKYIKLKLPKIKTLNLTISRDLVEIFDRQQILQTIKRNRLQMQNIRGNAFERESECRSA